jgi:hypothetical protein
MVYGQSQRPPGRSSVARRHVGAWSTGAAGAGCGSAPDGLPRSTSIS